MSSEKIQTNLTIRPTKDFFYFFAAAYIFIIIVLFLVKSSFSSKLIIGLVFSILMFTVIYRAAFKNIIKLSDSGLSIINGYGTNRNKFTSPTVLIPLPQIKVIKIENGIIEVIDKDSERYVMKVGIFGKSQLLMLKSALESRNIIIQRL